MCLLDVWFFERKDIAGKVHSSNPEKRGINTILVPRFLLASSWQLPVGLKDTLTSAQDISTHI